jgi:hypothetical protein
MTQHDHKAFGIAASNIIIMATTLSKLAEYEKHPGMGATISLTHDEVKAIMFTLRSLRDGVKESRQ